MSYDRTNTGTIAKNTRKTEDKHPDITGSLNVNGVEHWINGWLKKNSSDGSTFYSLSIKPKEARQQQAPQRGRTQAPPSDFSDLRGEPDDLPF